VTPEFKRHARTFAGVIILAAALVALYLWTFSGPRTPLVYMVAGTLATVILLAAAFVLIVKMGYLVNPKMPRSSRVTRRTARRSGQSS
jgi:hypothetical protein